MSVSDQTRKSMEKVGKEDSKEPHDSLWGLAWVVKDIKVIYDRLISEGVEVTEVKEGRKPNTLVATVKSHTCNIPTLLIQHL